MKAVVTFNQFIKAFPTVTEKSKKLARKILPLYPSVELAQIVGALLTDGHVDWYTSDVMPRTRQIRLYSSNKAECIWFVELCKKVFGVKGKVVAYIPKYGKFKLQPYKAIVNKAVVARILILAGAVAGNKSNQGYKIPEWIMYSNTEIKIEFLKTIFTFDGSKPYPRKNTWTIHYSASVNPRYLETTLTFFEQLRFLLAQFGVVMGENPTKYHKLNGNVMVITSISSRKSITNFYRFIGYLNPIKQKRLEFAVANISRLARVKCKTNLLENMKKIFGTDTDTLGFINVFLCSNYTYRQFEHFRRGESVIPIEILALAERITERKITLPLWIDFLISRFIVPSLQI